ncbi:MAG TPA: FAD-binding protein [Burkholderiales bacterium]|nr:FAD-binding protein [Burkholderiales bacterium]
MERIISRREFVKRLAGGAALLALQPSCSSLAPSLPPGLLLRNDLTDLSGTLLFDDAALQAAANDFGRIVHRLPIAVLKPGSAQDIVKLVQFANRHGLKVAMRGQAHSFFGQTQAEGGVVIDSSSLNSVRIINSGAVEVGAGAKWSAVLDAANASKRTLPVIADIFLSVGGTISTGGFAVTTYTQGFQVDRVLELQVVTGDGQLVTCSDERNSDLFNAMLGGLGQCGIIVKVVMELVAAPTHVLFFKLNYEDFQTASADLAFLAKVGRFNHLDGRGAAQPGGGIAYYVEGGVFYDAPNTPSEAPLLAGLRFANQTTKVMTYEQYYRREEVCTICTAPTLKPFVYLCLPSSRYVEYTSRMLATPEEAAFVTPRMSAWRRSSMKRPLVRLPNEDIVFRFQISRVLPASADISSAIAMNRTLYERARAMGGTRLTTSAIPFSQADWIQHYGPVWKSVQASKARFDPKNVLAPGHGMFPG